MRCVVSGLMALCLSLPALAQAPRPGDVVINEIQYDPPAGQPSGNEWIEVVNRSAGPVDLQGLRVSDGGTPSAEVSTPLVLAAGAFAVLVRDGAAFAAAYPGVPFQALSGFPTLNNSGDRVALLLGAAELDAVPYLPSWGGTDASLERRDPDGPSTSASNFGTTTSPAGGTPGAANSLFATDTAPPQLVSVDALDARSLRLRFDEALDAATAQDPARYSISNAVGAPTAAVLDGADGVVLTLAAPLAGPASYTLTVTGVRDRAGNALATAAADFFFGRGDAAAPLDLVLNEFLYDEPSADNPGEFVELFNRTGKAFDLREFTLNDGIGEAQPITTSARFVGPGEYVVIVEDGALFASVFPGVPFVQQPAWSALNNGGDAIVLRYQGALVDSLTYSPSWGGSKASLERKDPDGASTSASNFATTADPRGGTPGARNSQFQPDVTPPTVVSVVAESSTSVLVTFSEPVERTTATAVASYAIESGGATVRPTAATRLSDPSQVRLSTPALPDRASATLTVTGVTDLRGNAMAQARVPFFVGTPDAAGAGGLVINEIQYDPAAGSAGEYVEIVNTTDDRVFDLAAVSLDGQPLAARLTPIGPGEYATVARDVTAFRALYPEAPGRLLPLPTLSLSNGGDTIRLRSATATLDSVTYSPRWHRPELDSATGIALERRDPRGPSNEASNWSSSLDGSGGTPGRPNSIGLSTGEPPASAGLESPPPFAPDEGEAAQIRFRLRSEAALVRVRIFDGAGRPVREVVAGRLVGTEGSVVWDGRGDDGGRLRTGIYVLLLEAVDVEGGTTERHRGAVVLARR